MNPRHVPFLVLCITFVFSGCVSVTSVVDHDFHKQIGKVYIEVNTNEDMKSFFFDLGSALASDFSTIQIQSKVKELGPLTLDGPSAVAKEIDEYQPDLVMVVGAGEVKRNVSSPLFNSTTHTWSGGGEYTSGSNLQAALYLPNQDQAVWKATVSTNTLGFGMGSGSTAAHKIFAKIQEDGIFTGNGGPADTTKTGSH